VSGGIACTFRTDLHFAGVTQCRCPSYWRAVHSRLCKISGVSLTCSIQLSGQGLGLGFGPQVPPDSWLGVGQSPTVYRVWVPTLVLVGATV